MGNFFANLNAKMQAFMMGRNGADRLARWALGVSIVLIFINMFVPNVVCFALSYALLFYCVYRMFSSNVVARREENQKFEEFLGKFTRKGPGGSGGAGSRGPGGAAGGSGSGSAAGPHAHSHASGAPGNTSDKLTFPCEQCGQSLSVPKGRGTLKVTCPKCNHQQKVKS